MISHRRIFFNPIIILFATRDIGVQEMMEGGTPVLKMTYNSCRF